jgi:uncharacterized delta-60 repeat protein
LIKLNINIMDMRIILLLFTSLFAAGVFAQTSPLDLTFGTGGKVTTDIRLGDCRSNAVAIQPDGKILVAGHAYNGGNQLSPALQSYAASFSLVIIRMLPDGSSDATFGVNGVVKSQFGIGGRWHDIALRPDGKIMAAGTFYDANYRNYAVVARFLPNGDVDTGFNGVGSIVSQISQDQQYASSLALQPDGKILVTGYSSDPNSATAYNLFRYNPDGSLDTSFAGSGRVVTAAGGLTEAVTVTLQADGKILVAGKYAGSTNGQIIVIRYNTDGTLDSDFSILTPLAYVGVIARMFVVQPDGKLLIAGDGFNPSNGQTFYGLARYKPDGTVDSTFNASASPGLYQKLPTQVNSIAVQSDGKILLVGAVHSASPYNVFDKRVTRLRANGTLDVSFGASGHVTVGQFSPFFYQSAIALQSNGKIVVTSGLLTSSSDAICVSRLNTNGGIDQLFGAAGCQSFSVGHSEDEIHSISLAPDGKILACGFSNTSNYKLTMQARYNTDGSLDQTLDFNGIVIMPFNSQTREAKLIGLPDGSTLAASDMETASGGYHFGLAKMNPDGTPDPFFGTNGNGLVDIPLDSPVVDYASVRDFARQPDGKLLLTGYYAGNGAFYQAGAIVRCNSNGIPDSSFNGNGIVLVKPPFTCILSAMALLPNGKILVGGRARIGLKYGFGLFQFNSNGSPDTGFGVGGMSLTLMGTNVDAEIDAIAIQPNGDIIAAGHRDPILDYSPDKFELVVAKFKANGSLDTTFATSGKSILKMGEQIRTYSIVLKPDGKIVMPGYITDSITDFTLIQYTPNGQLDTAFGINGILRTDLGSDDEKAKSAVLQPDGKILVGGYTAIGFDHDFALLRYLPEGGMHVGTVDFTGLKAQLLVYPNPVSTSTTLEYTLPYATTVSIQLYDLQGRLLQTYLNEVKQETGEHKQFISIPGSVPAGQFVLVLTTPEGKLGVRIVH